MEIRCNATNALIGTFPDEVSVLLRNMSDGKHEIADVNGNNITLWVVNHAPFTVAYGDETFAVCGDCGKVIDLDDDWGYVEFEDKILCENCRIERLDYCEKCNTWHIKDSVMVVKSRYGDEKWCPKCVERFAFTCSDCRQITDKDYARSVGDKAVCRNCYVSNYSDCLSCGKPFHNSKLIVDAESGKRFCHDCMQAIIEDRNRPVKCVHCSATVRKADSKAVITRLESGRLEIVTVCAACYRDKSFECPICGRRHIARDNEQEYHLHDGRRICYECATRRTFICADCGGRYPTGSLFRHENVNYCVNCESRHRPVRVITGYHHYSGGSNVWIFRSLEQINFYKDLFMGIELEIDGGGENHNKAVQITTALGYPAQESNEFKCTTDGSLNDGFEIISMPATYEYHLKKYNWDAGMRKAAQLGYSSHDANTCGLHVHVNRSYFEQSIENPETSTVLLMCNNRPWLEKFSRRTRWNYCDFKGDRRTFKVEDFKTTNGQNDSTDRALRSIVSDCHGHGCMVNFGNHATIEFRLFRGTLKHKTFVATLQLVKMMCYAIRHFRKEQLANVDLRWFKKFAANSKYTEFLEYLDERGIMI